LSDQRIPLEAASGGKVIMHMAEQTPPAPVFDASTRLAFERTRVAYERTMMSWIRTATSLITFGFSIYKFFQIEVPNHERHNRLIGPRQFALLLVSIGLVSLLLATVEHRQNLRTLSAQYAGKQRSLAVLVAAFISLLGILALIAVIFRQ
jgi:inner membrane protein YidH